MNNRHMAVYLKRVSVTVFIIFQMLAVHTTFAQNWGAYQEETVIKVPGITALTQIPALTNSQKQVTRQYTDGLGRPIQTVAIGASPGAKDIIQPVVYDANLNRQSTAYLAYPGTTTDGSFHDNALTEQSTFYSTGQGGKVAIDVSPFSKQVFDNSPLQRLLQAGSFGDGFQPGQHYKTAVYRYNLSADNVLKWSSAGVSTGTYSDNSLSAVQTTDEQGVSTIVFTDNLGKTILKRQLISETIGGVTETKLDTYYVYNDDGSVSYVLPPKAVVTMRTASNYNITQTGVDALIFKMVYDSRGRLAQKTVPNGAALYMVYDPLNRPVLMQDGNMRAAHQWNYIKYDAKGRPTSQGIYIDDVSLTQAAMQTYVDGLDYSVNYYEAPNATLINGGYYTNNVFPKVNNVTGSTALQPLTYAYYDSYDLDRNGTADFSYQVQGLTGEATPSTQARGRLTVMSKTIIGLGVTAGTWLTSAVFYDNRGRAIQTQSRNHTNTAATLTDISTTVPDFTGKAIQTKVIKVLYGSTTTIVSTPTYDHHDRLLSVDQKYNSAAAIRIGAYTYNELGQMVTKNLHSKNAGSTFMQSVDYRFNIRGQMLSINNSTLTAGSNNTAGTNALFGMEFLYDKVDAAPNSLNNTPYYNGMISAVKWMAKTPTLTERSYKYSYDDQSRLTGANYADRAAGQGVWGNTGAYNEDNITYDHNGNIVTLKRNAMVSTTIQPVDNLAYTYIGNKLNTVTDGTGANYTGLGFKNMTGSATAYTYDTNGNLVTDAYKGTTSTYNVLNRVSKVTITTGTGKYINYTYDASAVLIRKQQYDNNALVKTTDYVDGFTGENAVLSYFSMPEGRIINSAGTLTPEYFVADQQGNVRVSFQEQGTTGVAVVKQENSYYPFGLIMPNSQIATPTLANKKLYNGGSEWQNDYSDLPDLYQTYYRSYDAALGRFTGIDPKAELTDALSPYHYAGNNPVLYNDPMGDAVNGGNQSNIDGNGHIIQRDHGYSWFNSWLNTAIANNEKYAKATDGGSSGSGGGTSTTTPGGMSVFIDNDGTMTVLPTGTETSYIMRQYTEDGIRWQYGTELEFNASNSVANQEGNDWQGFLNFTGNFLAPSSAYFSYAGNAMNASLQAGKWIGQNSREYSTIFNGSTKWLSGPKSAFVSKAASYSKVGNILGGVGLAITVGSAVSDHVNGKDNTSTWVNVGFNVALYGAGFVASVAAAPWIIGAGLIYTGARLVAGDQIDHFIDSHFGFR